MRYRDLGSRSVSTLCLGTLPFGSVVDDDTSFSLLDRFVERGGSFIDTANCYCFWRDGSDGGDSERLVGRWLAERGIVDEITVATKVGALPAGAGQWPANREGLSRAAVETAVSGSLRRLGRESIDLLYGHIDDPRTGLDETVDVFARLVADGVVDQVGMSNQDVLRFSRAREIARRQNLPAFTALQQRHTYLTPAAEADFDYQVALDTPMLDYTATQPDLTVLAYSSLLGGAYTGTKPVPVEYRHAATDSALAVLAEVADEAGATPNQVVYAWMLHGTPAVIPLVGVSSLGQLDEALDAVELDLTVEQCARLDAARAARTTVARAV
ncbi:Predicted oxidoreductase [Actinacidiphila alni]|uniref:Predicted oxidoreductase n=1 Tax=Actinacidiphila alni TaxID=380248 RepID=A0A1I2LB61_9ACTN|nr:aldo/keto reductase [Actinacidiphila alni]SFF76632.1 Predicted oxidoreductase [Actinacidiphila alni]